MRIDDLMARAVNVPRTHIARARNKRLVKRIGAIGPTESTETRGPAGAAGTAGAGWQTEPAAVAQFTWHTATDAMTWSDGLLALLGYEPDSIVPSKGLFLSHLHPADCELVRQAITSAWTGRCAIRASFRVIRVDRTVLDVDVHLGLLLDGRGRPRGVVGTGQDVTVRERARREAERLRRRSTTVCTPLADWDPGTGLFTRRRFADEVDRALRFGAGSVLVIRVEPAPLAPAAGTAVPAPAGTAVPPGTCVKVDPDELFRMAARLLEGLAEPTDQLGVVGPSEIAVLLPEALPTKAARLAEYFVTAVRARRFETPDGRWRANAWGGLIRYSRGAQVSSDELLIDAESAWRSAKRLDQVAVTLAQPVRASDRQTLCRDRIADALRSERFTLYAQPILELESNRVTRHELLLRVVDEVNGPLAPVAFLDAAERLDTVLEIDLWVLEQAMELLSTGSPSINLQVNLSGRSLGDARLTQAVDGLFARYQFDPRRLTFEITETAVIGNVTQARRFADRVRGLGCQLALDDFGSGYGSFRYLKMFPVDLVKIDGEFIENLVNSETDQIMVRAVAEVCQAYGIRTIAEFVQDEPTMELLRRLGVELVQGYLIGAPEPITDLALRPSQPQLDGTSRP
jgi:PAS domain S-box-containing protein